CIGSDDTGRTWICIGINTRKRQKRKTGALIKWRSRRVWRRVRWRRVCTKKQFRDQAKTKTPNCAREIPAALIEATPGNLKGVTGDIPVAAENAAGTFPKIGNNHNIHLVISCARFDPRLPLAHLVGCSEVGVPVTAADLKSAEFVD